MKIVESVSAWDLDDLIRATLADFRKCKTKYQINTRLTRFLGRLPNCDLDAIKKILDKPEHCNG